MSRCLEAKASCSGFSRHEPWLLVEESNLSYHKKESILLTIDPDYGNLS